MPQKRNKQLIILLILVTVLGASWVYTHKGQNNVVANFLFKHKKTVTPESVVGAETVSDIGKTEIKISKRNPIRYLGRQSRDPLDNSAVVIKKEVIKENIPKPQVEEEFPKSKFFVSAIIWGTDNPQAIINDKVVNIGGVIDDAKVIKIDKKGVLLELNGIRDTLEVK